MFDAKLRPLIAPPLNRLGSALARRGVTANAITFLGLTLGLAGAAARYSAAEAVWDGARRTGWRKAPNEVETQWFLALKKIQTLPNPI